MPPTRSSDLWSGDVPASSSTFGYEFRGRRIVTAVIDALATNHGLGSTGGEQMLFGGCSAGAIGAMSNLDAVADQTAALGVTTLGFLDAAALVSAARGAAAPPAPPPGCAVVVACVAEVC